MLAANQPFLLAGWRRHEAVYDAYQDPGGDHRALVAELVHFVAQKKMVGTGYLENLLIPLGVYDLLPSTWLMWGDDYAGYRRSPQFKRFIRQSGAIDYWREHGYPSQGRPLGADDFECD
jgi:hypothetical protein